MVFDACAPGVSRGYYAVYILTVVKAVYGGSVTIVASIYFTFVYNRQEL
jgi:hypothetical protein